MKKECSVRRAVNFLGKRWTLLILLELYKGKSEWKRFSQIKKNLDNITPKILSARLKELKKEKLIEKRVNAKEFPIKSEYRLTKSGEDFINAVQPRYAMISNGKDNKYGHPHGDTLDTLRGIGAQIFRTDLLGTIVMKSDGKVATFSFQK